MPTQCTHAQLQFHAFGARQVIGRFDGGRITSYAGGVLLREVDLQLGLLGRLSQCLSDYHNPNSVEHTVSSLLGQRVFALALGYEDLNDQEALRADSLLALLVGKSDLKGNGRVRVRDRGYPLASASTLHRLELGTAEVASSVRYKRIAADAAAMDQLLVDMFMESYAKAPREIWLDLDATDDPVHGRQKDGTGHARQSSMPRVRAHYRAARRRVTCSGRPVMSSLGHRSGMPRPDIQLSLPILGIRINVTHSGLLANVRYGVLRGDLPCPEPLQGSTDNERVFILQVNRAKVNTLNTVAFRMTFRMRDSPIPTMLESGTCRPIRAMAATVSALRWIS